MVRNKKHIPVLLCALCVPLLINPVYGQGGKKFLRQGNSKYYKNSYPESEILYRKALETDTRSTDALFNLGDALYRQNKFDDASRQYIASSETGNDPIRKSQSYYNLGNALLRNNKIEESIEAYKNSLRLNPAFPEAKYNLAYAQDMLKKQQQQQDQQKSDQDKKEEQKQKQDQNQNQDNKDQNKNQDQQQQQQQQKQGISREDAERILNALANDEKKVQEKVKEAKAAKERVRTLINW